LREREKVDIIVKGACVGFGYELTGGENGGWRWNMKEKKRGSGERGRM
jgi:hypothetical protein